MQKYIMPQKNIYCKKQNFDHRAISDYQSQNIAKSTLKTQ